VNSAMNETEQSKNLFLDLSEAIDVRRRLVVENAMKLRAWEKLHPESTQGLREERALATYVVGLLQAFATDTQGRPYRDLANTYLEGVVAWDDPQGVKKLVEACQTNQEFLDVLRVLVVSHRQRVDSIARQIDSREP